MKGYGRGAVGQGAGMQFSQFGYDQNEYGDDDDDDEGAEYGMEQYYDEDSDEDEDGEMPPEYLQNAPPGGLFQGGNQMGKGGPMGGPMGAKGQQPFGGPVNQGYGGQINPTSGVPFYGQANRMASSSGFGMGNNQPAMAMNMGMPSQPSMGGGGFSYGMASKGGSLFGPPSGAIGVSSSIGGPSTQSPGLFSFGSVSQFGGVGGGIGGGGSLFGNSSAGASNDPYANIAIDLTKVKKAEPPAKPYEQKTEEEKKKESKDKKTTSNAKSNLKRDYDDDDDNKRKKNVQFGKSTTYEITGEDSENGDYNNNDVREGKGSPRPMKKVIDEKDLSDGRNEKEKIKDLMAKEEQEQLDEIRKMNEWKQKQEKAMAEEKKNINIKKDDFEDSIDESSSLSNHNFVKPNKQSQEKESSYESDDFEEMSASGSGSKSKLNYWPGKEQFVSSKKIEESYSVSQSQEKNNNNDDNVYDPSIMEAYLKKQQQNSSIVKKQPIPVEASESSDKYDDDFESMSKSQTALQNIQNPPNKQQQKPAFEYKQQEQQTAKFKSVIETYVKKDNKFCQTDEGKYQYIEADQLGNGTFKEWTLQQNLKDAENLIQELKGKEADQKQKIYDVESQMKKKDVELQSQRREALDAKETSKRVQEQLKDALHKNNLYQIETEELIKQIDLADAKTREKEDDIKLLNAEYDRKLTLQEERILFRRGKQDERDTYEMKRQHAIELEELKRKLDEKSEELDYYMQKVAKIESENKTLKVGKDSNKRIKELEEEISDLKSQVNSNYKVQQENINLKNINKDLSKEDQIRIQRELQQLELLVKGYQEENEKALFKHKQLEKDLKIAQDKLYNESKKVKDLQQKSLLDREKVYVEEVEEEIDIQTQNNMGTSNAISQKELQELYSNLQRLQLDKSDIERDYLLKEGQLKSQINRLRDEKQTCEKKLLDNEFLVGEKEREIIKLKDEIMKEKQVLTERIEDLEEKVQWYRSNQKLISQDDDEKDVAMKELQQLKEKVKKADEDQKRLRDLEKKCKQLEETIKSKNPNNIPMLIQATKDMSTTDENKNEIQRLKEQNKQLTIELDDKDKDFDKRIRTLRQEQERMKQMYEKRQGQTPESKRIQELEDEIQKTKDYYNKRIREIEDKNKYRVPQKDTTKSKNEKDKNKQQSNNIENESLSKLQEQIDQITKERNMLAQKVVNLQSESNKRREQLNSPPQQTIDDPKSQYLTTIYSLINMIKQMKNEDPQNIFSFIQTAVSFVEQLKSVDAQKSYDLAQLFKSLTQSLQNEGMINEKIVQDIIDLCKIQPNQKHQQYNRMNSAQLNKDLIFDEDYLQIQKSPTKIDKPQKSLNPFVVQQQNQKQIRSIHEVLKQLVNSGIDFEKQLGNKQRKINLSQLYQLLKEESDIKNITLDETKSLIKYVKQKSGFESEEIGFKKVEEIDIQDLVNVLMDVSLEIFNKDEVGKITDSFMKFEPKKISKEKQDKVQSDDNSQIKELRQELIKQKENREEEQYANQNKIQRLQKTINDLQQQKDSLEDRLQKVEQSKARMENILKQNLGIKNTLKKTNGSENDILDEVGLIVKRLEYLEQQSEERGKQVSQDHIPCKKELQRLQQALDEEKTDKMRLLQKKNSEVAYFKAELDALLSEMKNSFVNKRKQVKQ